MKFGWRIIKTGLAVALCVWIAQLLNFKYPFYSAIAAVIALQATLADSWRQGIIRMQGTLVGAITGYVFALVAVHNPWWTGLGLIVTLAILKAMRWTDAINIASIVFIAITINITGPPLNYASSRIIDTLLGITVAFAVNQLFFPPRYKNAVASSFQHARQQVITTFRLTVRSLLDAKLRVNSEALDELNSSLATANKLVQLKQKEHFWGKVDEHFRQTYIGPLCRLEQMAFAINQINTLRQTWLYPLSPALEADLVELLNRTYFLISLITQPDNNVAPSAYDATAVILETIKAKVGNDQDGAYSGVNRVAVLELGNWVEQMIRATTACLRLEPAAQTNFAN
ncbi:MAG: aromatic acid exporter family protein [Peptococcaceae bacterium]|nr:aromatic acid exporter family protein [Peptococcaceae bacterium]